MVFFIEPSATENVKQNLLPLTSCAMRRARRCDVPCEAMRGGERRVVPARAVHSCSASLHKRPFGPSGPFLLRFSTQASLRAERSIIHYPFSLSHCKVTTRGRRNQEFCPNDAARPSFSSLLAVAPRSLSTA